MWLIIFLKEWWLLVNYNIGPVLSIFWQFTRFAPYWHKSSLFSLVPFRLLLLSWRIIFWWSVGLNPDGFYLTCNHYFYLKYDYRYIRFWLSPLVIYLINERGTIGLEITISPSSHVIYWLTSGARLAWIYLSPKYILFDARNISDYRAEHGIIWYSAQRSLSQKFYTCFPMFWIITRLDHIFMGGLCLTSFYHNSHPLFHHLLITDDPSDPSGYIHIFEFCLNAVPKSNWMNSDQRR